MKYALNIADLFRMPPIINHCLLIDIIPNKIIIRAEKNKIDGGAIVLECNERRAKSIIHIIRNKFKKHEIRAYQLSDNLKNAKRVDDPLKEEV